MDTKPLAYLQLTSLDAFVEELKRRGIYEARISEWIQCSDVFEKHKLRLTALDAHNNLILRYETAYYQGLAFECESEEIKRLRDAAKWRIVERLKAESISVLNGEFHSGKF
jgi:hypothetical protein